MREILFRGKRVDDGTWAYGYYGVFKDHHDIYVPFTEEEEKENEGHIFSAIGGLWHHVNAETVGQFTGYFDKNGIKIFEGDVFQLEDDIIGVVDYNHGCFFLTEYGFRGAFTEGGYDEYGGGWGVIDHEPMHFWFINKLEIIGNIYDNPEFLEVR